MHEHRRLPAEVFVQQQMLGRRRHPLFPADHVGDLHQVIVDDVREVIRRQAIGLEQHLHVDGRVFIRDRAAREVDDDGGTCLGDLHAHDERLAGRRPLRRLPDGNRRAQAVVLLRQLGGPLRGAHHFEPLRRTKTAERVGLHQQLLGVRAVDLRAVALAIRPEKAADVRTLIPGQPGPAQRGENRAFRFRCRAGPIRVLDAQDEIAAAVFGKCVVDQRDVRRADVRITGR